MLFNWPVKVISLVFAIVLYLIINYGMLDRREVEIPLRMIQPRGFTVTSTVPSSVTLVIQADERIIRMIDPSVVAASVDFSFIREEGVASAPVVLTTGTAPVKGEVAFSTEPELIKAFFAKTGSAENESDGSADPGGIEL